MSDTPKVSIGLPVYNGEKLLARAIDSVLAQDFEDWELLISDNGSNDGTREIIDRYVQSDPRISAHLFEENQGAVANFAVVFEQTGGPFFMWLAHDDYLAPGYLSSCLARLEPSDLSVMAFAGMNVVDESGEVFRDRVEPMDAIDSASAVRRLHSVLWDLGDPTAPVFGLVRRDALAKTGLIRNSNEPDRILIGELSILGKLHQIPDRLFFHYGPKGHTNRDNWAWLNPKNRGRPRFATFRIVGHQWNAIWRSRHGVVSKLAMSADLLVASLIKRTAGKVRSIRRQMRR